MNIKGFILVEGKKKNVRVFASTLGLFLDYLENREDGVFAAIYFVDKKFNFCFGENGERGSNEANISLTGLKSGK